MKLRVAIRVVICLLLISSSAQARLGESLKSLEKRWGKCFVTKAEIGNSVYTFTHKPWIIHAVLWNDEAVMLQYQKIGQNEEGAIPIPESDVAAILKLNSGGKEWKKRDTEIKGVVMYLLPQNPNLIAFYEAKNKKVTLANQPLLEKAQEAQAKKNTDGL